MARNVEIKARVHNMDRTRHLVAEAAERDPEELEQIDTFFQVDSGRLKLREFGDGTAELIYYNRPNQPGPKESSYERTPISHAPSMRDLLARELGVVGCVRKKRLVFWAGRTRVHLDEVEQLGNFLELEVVLNDEEPFDNGVREAEELMGLLGVDESALIPDAYIDLLRRDEHPSKTRDSER